MQALGGFAAAWDLWERALIPSLLSGVGSWLGDIREAVKLCDEIQDFDWKILCKVPDVCPKLPLRCKANMRISKRHI